MAISTAIAWVWGARARPSQNTGGAKFLAFGRPPLVKRFVVNVAMWLCGDGGVQQCGYEAMWLCGYVVAIWPCGYTKGH